MRVALVNELGNLQEAAPAQLLTLTDLQDIAAVLEKQSYDRASFWQAAPIQCAAFAALKDVDRDASIIAFFWSSDQAGALGYHDVTPDGRPYAKVFLEDTLSNGGTLEKGPNSVSVTASHEFLEMCGDPYANWWASRNGYQVAIELCDLVESDSYEIDGVSVSNFLGPRAFEQYNRIAPTDQLDWLGILKHGTFSKPRPGCYEIRQSVTATSYPVYGEGYPEWRKALKSHPASRTAQRLGLHRPRDLMVIGEDVPESAVQDLKNMARWAKGVGLIESAIPRYEAHPPAADIPKPLFTGKLTDLVRRG